MDRFLELLTNLNDFMWTYFLIGLVIVTGIYFTFSTKFVQFTYIKEMFRLIMESWKRRRTKRCFCIPSIYNISSISCWNRDYCRSSYCDCYGWTRFSVLDVDYGFIWRSIIICRVYISPSI